MIIEYIHASAPDEIRHHDTEKTLRNNSFIKMSQEQFDEFEFGRFAADAKSGLIISFKIISKQRRGEAK